MYIPNNMVMTENEAIIEFIAEFSFGLIISPSLEATHLPLLYEPSDIALGYLYGHFAKANPQWRSLENQRVLVIFSGPHSYISPTWYANRPAVPTWNYAAIHCYGLFEILNEAETARSMDALVSKYEPQLHQNTELMPQDYKRQLSKAVVGFRVVIDDIQAKEKLGQQRKKSDQQGVYHALSESTNPDTIALLAYMKKRNLGLGN